MQPQQPQQQGSFRVTLSIRKEPEGGPVFCKMEQTQRFKQLKTVKLHTDTTYRVDVSFKPPRSLHTACAYSSYYTTEGLKPSKKGTREDLCIVMKGGLNKEETVVKLLGPDPERLRSSNL
ncbi:Uncharacterized protein C2orf32-like protein [Gryllus bimaculatus]|nr:Uncharacterized protein C2orf32-like protein [Gryllus bimaculatus]